MKQSMRKSNFHPWWFDYALVALGAACVVLAVVLP